MESKIFKENLIDQPGIETFVNDIDQLYAETTEMRNKGYKKELIDTERQQKIEKIKDDYFVTIDSEIKKIESELEARKQSYEKDYSSNYLKVLANQNSVRAKYDSLPEDHILDYARDYINGRSDITDPYELNVIAGLIKKAPEYENYRDTLHKNRYNEPWLANGGLELVEYKESLDLVKYGQVKTHMGNRDIDEIISLW